ncbi:MAG TPA: TRAP transporter TatT component family protein [Myxococcales bacterium]
MRLPLPNHLLAPALALLVSAPLTGCSSLIANIAADSLSGDGSAFSSDDDPELVRDAIPFGLKTMEALLESSPDNPKLLTAVCSGFTQYAYAFVLADADELEPTDPAKARAGAARGKKLLRRATNYGFRGLAARGGKEFPAAFEKDRAAALKPFGREDVPLLYWTGASLAILISRSKDDMKMVGRLQEVEALMARALELDEAWGDGSIHEFYVTYDNSRGEAVGGGLQRAKAHYDRALELSKGKKIGALVSWAEAVAIQNQDRKLFDQLLDRVLAFNVDEEPRFRLVNLISQRRARFLKAHVDDYFLE